jgi:hypothetical protein
MMKVIVVFKRLLLSGNDNMAAIYSNGGNRWNILGFNFTKRDALSSVYKISMGYINSVMNSPMTRTYKRMK